MPPETFLDQPVPVNLSIEKKLKTAAIKFAKRESKSLSALVAELLAKKTRFDRSGGASEAGRRRTAEHCCSLAPLLHRSLLRFKFVTLVTFLTTALCPVLSAYITCQLSYFTQPGGAIDEQYFDQQPVIHVLDASGQLLTSFNDDVTIAKANGAGTLSGNTTVKAHEGIATFTDLSIKGAGHHVLEATSSGCTARRSGMMTVNPAATTARVALHFGQNTTDKGDCGSGASIDNLTMTNMTVMGRLKRTASGNNQFVTAKYSGSGSSEAGWDIQVDDSSGAGTLIAITKCNSSSLSRASSSYLMAQDVWYDFAAKWVRSTKKWGLYLKPVGTALAQVSYTPAPVAGSGDPKDDNAASLYIGNVQLTGTGANPFKGDIEWMAVFSKALSDAEMLTVQIGFSRADPTMITNVGSCELLHRLNATGTLTDLSGTNNCAITGATPTPGQTIFVPTVWGNSIDATDKTDYLFTNSHATVSYSTTATSAIISAQRTLEAGPSPSPGYDLQASITVLVDGVYNTEALFPRPLTAANLGKAFATVTLPGGSKIVTFVNGPRSRALTNSPEGTFLTTALFNASATEVIPPTPTKNIVFLADSVLDDFLAAPVGSNGVISQLREYLRDTHNVMVEGYGGAKLKDYATDSTARAATVATIAKYNPTILVTDLAANDYQGSAWTAANYGTAFEALLTALHAEMPLLQIYVCTMVTRPLGEGPNGLGNDAAAYRTAASNAAAAANTAAGTTFCIVIDGPTELWNGDNTDDHSHPNNDGSAAMLENIKRFLGLN